MTPCRCESFRDSPAPFKTASLVGDHQAISRPIHSDTHLPKKTPTHRGALAGNGSGLSDRGS